MIYDRLIDVLDRHDADYSLIDHAPEGRTRDASRLRGHELSEAAKCVVVRVETVRHLLGVVPGDARLDLGAVQRLYGATRVKLAPTRDAERLTGCATGSIVPFAFDRRELDLIVDRALLDHEKVYFNAGRLDRSLALRTGDYLDIAQPHVDRIADLPRSGATARRRAPVDYNDRRFRAVSTDGRATATAHYHQRGDLVWAEFEGGDVRRGSLTGRSDGDGVLEFGYSMVLRSGMVVAGFCTSEPTMLDDGRIRLRERWRRFLPIPDQGLSVIEEVPASAAVRGQDPL